MPNTGRPSPGCHLCRSRRVKCDLTQPECLRCTTYGAACPGYRTEIDLLFHQEQPGLDIKKKKKKNKHRRRPSANVQLELPSSPPPAVDCQVSHYQKRPYFDLLRESVEEESLDPHSGGSFAFLSELDGDVTVDHCMANAAHALAHSLAAAHWCYTHYETSQWYYCAALEGTTRLLSSTDLAVHDATITVVWLLSLYEMLAGNFVMQASHTGSGGRHQHCQGLASLIQLRGPEQFRTRRGRNMIWAALEQVVTRCIEAKEVCPSICWQWLVDISHFAHEEEQSAIVIYSFLLEASSIMCFIAQTVGELATHAPAEAFATVLALLERLETLESRELLPYHLLEQSSCQRHLWNNYRCVRVILYYDVVQLVEGAATAAAESGWKQGWSQLQELRTLSLESAKEMVEAFLTDISISVYHPYLASVRVWGESTCTQFDSLGWDIVCKNLWAVFAITKHDMVEGEHFQRASMLLTEIYRQLCLKPPLMGIDRDSACTGQV